MDRTVEKIRAYQHEVFDHLMELVDKGYKKSTFQEQVGALALAEMYNELCDVIKSVEKHAHDEQSRVISHAHDEHDNGTRRR